ncbi:MAG TPA: cyclic nucleotide-binding domain-containing protein [Methylibium sp.]|uniref:cyclic nucleotide-binding domain-containing protein n=1 Tax=Methylibium sp. TaxID=2067992 RepID=UPI002DBA448D|nr:cyclic nucleotide-binding domain-containing protein [Methylibium sp.]HEU4459468.1 cyclic nucleotide-binding domain-containing protein [Methylibium sp.]
MKKFEPAQDGDESRPAPLDADERTEAPTDVSWPARAAKISAKPHPRDAGTALFMQLWRSDGHGLELNDAEMRALAQYLDFALVPAGAELIAQDERGDFLLVLLEGRIGVEHVRPSGERPRLAEARAGDLLGEMSLLDAGPRSTACTTRTPCLVAVLEARRLDAMMESAPRLALAVVTALARRLSLRLREVSARLSALLGGA